VSTPVVAAQSSVEGVSVAVIALRIYIHASPPQISRVVRPANFCVVHIAPFIYSQKSHYLQANNKIKLNLCNQN